MTRPSRISLLMVALCSLATFGGCDSDDVAEPPPTRDRRDELQRIPVDPERANRSRIDSDEPENEPVFDVDRGPEAESNDAIDTEPLPEPEETPFAGERGIELEAIDAQTSAPLERFRFARAESDGRLLEALIDADRIGFVALEEDESAFVVLEAPGYEPSAAIELELAAGETGRRLRIEMQPVAARSGVELTIWRPDTSPATKVQVLLERREITAAFDAPFQRVWERAAENTEGLYRFPDLRPGRYRARIQAMDPDGEPALLLPHDFEFDFEGVSLFQQTIVLSPGGQILLTVLDPTSGEPIARSDVNVWLLDGAGAELEVQWMAREGEQLYAAEGSLPRPRACRLASPLQPGLYTLRVRRRVDRTDPSSRVDEIEVPVSVVGGIVTEQTVR